MTPERWQQIKGVLATALEQPDEQARAYYLATTCANDTTLRREVQSLLDQPPDQFEVVAATIGLAQAEPFTPGRIGRRVGAYELVRELGRGGMGTVWLAQRADHSFEKKVAIKLLKRGTDTDEVLRRFHAERQILARLDHPNIARLLDAGTTDDGLPFFVMEFVEGRRLAEFVVAKKLPLLDRLRLFLKICAAVQFAHQNLIVHRDLKPGNILVTSDGEPKLLDFGVAKLLAPEAESWQLTIAGHERFTPGYASPEQVRAETITTVSDVYSLGAILYEVLTGIPPHRFPNHAPTTSQIFAVICEEEPARPSNVTTDAEMRSQLRGDLDNIVLRALAKAPARRYRGAGDFADDVRRYLGNRPVHARPDTFSYRAGKFLRRNKKAAVAAALIVVSLVAGTLATLRQAQVANRERARAVRRFNEVRKIANSFMMEFHNLIAELPGSLAARQLVTQKAVDYLDSLAQEAGNDLSLQSELALAYDRIGSVTFDVRQAIATHEKAVALNEKLVDREPKNLGYRRQLSASYGKLSDVMKIAGHSANAIDYARKSLRMMESVAATEPSSPALRSALAECELTMATAEADAGKLPEALASSHQALVVYEALARQNSSDKLTRRELETAYIQVTADENSMGDHEAALSHAEKAFQIAQENFGAEPSNSIHRRGMWRAHYYLGLSLAAKGDALAARRHYEQAIEFLEGLASADPNDTGHRRWLALTYSAMGDTLADLGQREEALSLQEKAIHLDEKLATEDTGRAEVTGDLAKVNQSLGELWLKDSQIEKAETYLQQAESLVGRLLNSDPNNLRLQRALTGVRASMAACHPPTTR